MSYAGQGCDYLGLSFGFRREDARDSCSANKAIMRRLLETMVAACLIPMVSSGNCGGRSQITIGRNETAIITDGDGAYGALMQCEYLLSCKLASPAAMLSIGMTCTISDRCTSLLPCFRNSVKRLNLWFFSLYSQRQHPARVRQVCQRMPIRLPLCPRWRNIRLPSVGRL